MEIILNKLFVKTIIEQLGQHDFLNEELLNILSGEFIMKEGCYTLSSLNQQAHTSLIDFEDENSYECFLNSINIDDYVENNLFECAIFALQKIHQKWIQFNQNKILIAILIKTDFGYNIKFHLERNKPYIDENSIDKFDEAVLILKLN
jgi:hypothetical protein